MINSHEMYWWGKKTTPATLQNVIDNAPKGWAKLITELVSDLFALGWDGTICQVKEKFGGLRFYIGSGSDAVWDRIDKAERESYTICQVCGEPGKPNDSGWIWTTCELHRPRL
jgi:hypothetical protein